MERLNQVILEGRVASVADNSFALDIDDAIVRCVRLSWLLKVNDIVRVTGKLRDNYVCVDHIEKVK